MSNFFFKPSLCYSVCSPVLDLAADVFSAVSRHSLTQHTSFEQGTARSLLAALRVRCNYLNSKLFHSHAGKECTYLPPKCFTEIFSLIFLKISVWATARKDESFLFATEACEDLDESTRWGNPSKVVQKSAPMEPRNQIIVSAVNLPHKRRRQCTHMQPISRGQLRGKCHR
jgi:hypothetical protein